MISLITICWNSAASIARTLDSVMEQTLRPDEYFFVDGGSTDGTLDILENYRPQFEALGVKFAVESQRRVQGEAGIPSAWNQALAHVKGDIVGLLNADDWYEPEALRLVSEAFDGPDAPEAVSAAVQMHHEDHDREWVFVPGSLSALPWKMPVPHPGTFFKRSVYERLGLYDTHYRISADYDFVWRCSKAGIRWHSINEILVNMQLGGVADTSRALARKETFDIARRHSGFFDFRPALAWLLRAMTGR